MNRWLKNIRASDHVIYEQETDLVNTLKGSYSFKNSITSLSITFNLRKHFALHVFMKDITSRIVFTINVFLVFSGNLDIGPLPVLATIDLHHVHPFIAPLISKRKHHPLQTPPTNQTLPNPKQSKKLDKMTLPSLFQFPPLKEKANRKRNRNSLMTSSIKSVIILPSTTMTMLSPISLENHMETFESSVGTSEASKGVMLQFLWTL